MTTLTEPTLDIPTPTPNQLPAAVIAHATGNMRLVACAFIAAFLDEARKEQQAYAASQRRHAQQEAEARRPAAQP